MKKLFLSLLCSAIGISAFAKDLKINVKPAAPAVVAKSSANVNDVQVSTERQANDMFRRQMAFGFRDSCGKVMIVYVSGGNSLSDVTLWNAAADYAESQMNMVTGCFI
ncbi:hypothetical protein FPZ42_06860 [Mucilaginibacter achroorhodeus]|uniref:Uncharacterized protein n=1 Tax=Mucilaginibacter achroorhodeus TaxID=2599294 RepID=A0A563U5Y3_9SPHI|nr:hypothetical protein [Mucilaginibacter achroorhodeus]TWR26752.1 hypothetical protein FPZ42_06860 [Mucilaginibacter achroorhodeus]